MALDEVMKLKGAQFAVEFDAQGTMTGAQGELREDLATLIARFAHANIEVAKSLAEDYTVMGGVGIEYPTAFGLIGRKRASFARKNRSVMLLVDEMDLNEVIKGSW
jgi:roadblock/LC7 domain-containing protein